MTNIFSAVTAFGILPVNSEHIEVFECRGILLIENNFNNLMQSGSSTFVNLRMADPESTTVTSNNDDFVFAVPEPFGSYQQNLFNQKATPVFRQNCFIIESPKQCKPFNRFKKLAPKRLSRSRCIRI